MDQLDCSISHSILAAILATAEAPEHEFKFLQKYKNRVVTLRWKSIERNGRKT